MSIGLTAILIAVGAAFVGVLSQQWLAKDNAIEQVAETVIKEETGLSVDLSPESPASKP